LWGKNWRNSLANWAASAVAGASTRVGFWTFSIVRAMVADLRDPVMPRRVCTLSPASMPAATSAMAFGWSRDGWNSETTRDGGMPDEVTGGYRQFPTAKSR